MDVGTDRSPQKNWKFPLDFIRFVHFDSFLVVAAQRARATELLLLLISASRSRSPLPRRDCRC